MSILTNSASATYSDCSELQRDSKIATVTWTFNISELQWIYLYGSVLLLYSYNVHAGITCWMQQACMHCYSTAIFTSTPARLHIILMMYNTCGVSFTNQLASIFTSSTNASLCQFQFHLPTFSIKKYWPVERLYIAVNWFVQAIMLFGETPICLFTQLEIYITKCGHCVLNF